MLTVEDVNDVLALRDPFRNANNKFDSALMIELGRLLRQSVSPTATVNKSFLYYSPLRPTSFGLKLPGAHPLNERWWYAEKPLPPKLVVRFELQPVYLSLARFIYDVSQDSNIPVELTKTSMPEDGFSAVALFLNPKKKWQLSTFTDGVGPVGHVEGAPEELLTDAIYSQKYRYWNPGAVDRIVENSLQLQRRNPSEPITVAAVNRILAKPDIARKPNGRLDMDLHFQIAEAYADVFGKHREYGYVSKRPLTLPGLTVVTQIGDNWFYGSRRPLNAARIVEHDLQPFDLAMSAFLLGASQVMGKPIELVKSARLSKNDWVYALFRNPTGKWQLSRFEVGEGPVGHAEGDDAQVLLVDPLRQGYRVWLEGAVDRVFDMPRSNPSAPSSRVGTATLLRELRSPEQGYAVSDGGVRVGKAVLVRFDPPLAGVEYAMASHLVKQGQHEVAFFPSDKQGRWPTRLIEIITVFGKKTVAAALAQLNYEPRTSIA